MSAEANRALLDGYIDEVWVRDNPEGIERFVAPHYQRHMSPTTPPLDPKMQVERIKGFRAAFPDIDIVVHAVVAEEDHVAFHSTMRGTHLGEFLGIPPTGKTFEVNLVDFIRIEDGKFVEQWGGPDMLDLLKQLGASLTAPE